MIKTHNSRFVARSAGAGALVAAAASQAAIDVTGVTTAMADGLVAIGTIGGAILLAWGTKKVYGLIMGGR